jgi:hypothetical protein
MSDFSSDPAALAPAPYDVPIETLRGLVRTLPRPAPDAPAATWQGVVQGGLDAFTALDARDGQQAQLAVQVIAAGAAATPIAWRSRRVPRRRRQRNNGPAPSR